MILLKSAEQIVEIRTRFFEWILHHVFLTTFLQCNTQIKPSLYFSGYLLQ